MAAVASKNLTVRFIADTAKWRPGFSRVMQDLKAYQKQVRLSFPGGGGKGGAPGPGGGGNPRLPGAGGGMFDKGSELASLIKGDFSGAMLGLAGKFAIAAAAGLALVSSFQKIIAVGSETRNSIVQFKTLLGGSEQTAISFYTTLKKFGATTPLELPEIAMAAKQLLAVKVAANDVVPSLRMLGDISKISGKNFNELATIYAKNKASNFIQGEDLNQLIEAGIPVLDEFGKMFGKTAIQVKEMGSKNQITFEHLQTAFKNMTSQGGIYFNGMADQAKEVPGIWSNIMDSWNDIFRAISGADLSSDTISFWSFLKSTLADFAERFSAFVETIRPMLVELGTSIGAIFRAVWDVVIAIWDVMKVVIIPLSYLGYMIFRGLLFGITKVAQLVSFIAKGISYVVNLVWQALDGLLGITSQITAVVTFLQSLYMKIVTIFTVTTIFIESMFDYMVNGGLAKLGNAIYDSIVGGFTRAWEWVQNTELYKLLGATANKISAAATSGIQIAKDELGKRLPLGGDLSGVPTSGGNNSNSSRSTNNSKNTSNTVNNNYNIKLNKQEESTVSSMFNQTGRPLFGGI